MGSPPQRLLHYLFMLTAAAKKQAADELRRMAAELERQAAADARIDDARAAVRRHRQTRADLINAIARMIVAGAPVALVANRYPDLSPEQVQAFYDAARPLAGRLERMERDRELLRLAARGWTNGQLAARFGISESQVTRIISATWRKRP